MLLFTLFVPRRNPPHKVQFCRCGGGNRPNHNFGGRDYLVCVPWSHSLKVTMMLLGVSCDPIPKVHISTAKNWAQSRKVSWRLGCTSFTAGGGANFCRWTIWNYTSCVNLKFYKRNPFSYSQNHNFRQNGMRPISIDSSDKEREFLGLVSKIFMIFLKIRSYDPTCEVVRG